MHERFSYKKKEELLNKAAELGFDLPFSDDISPLFTSLKIKEITVQNRLVVQPMEGYDSLQGGEPSDLTERRYLRYAAGGNGVIWFEAVAVLPEGRSNPRQLWINEENVNKFSILIDKISETASLNNMRPLLNIQLTHSGRYSKPAMIPRPLAAAANPVLDKAEPHILTDKELIKIQDSYLQAAMLSSYAGFDAIDIKACHGYLMIDLLAARSRKGSIYGGESHIERFKFLLETIERIRNSVPGMLITTRLNISDVYEGGFGMDENNKPDYTEALLLVKELEKAGISLINISMGSPYHNPHVTRPFDTPLPGNRLPEQHPLTGVMKMIEGTALFSREFPEIYFVGSAYSWLRQFAPNVGAAVLQKGYASLIGFGRSSFAYPSMPADLRKNGKADPSKVCITCSGCTRLIRNFRPGGCVIRDKEIYGKELRKLIADGK